MVKIGQILELNLIHNKRNNQINMSLSKKELPREIRDKLSEYKKARLWLEELD